MRRQRRNLLEIHFHLHFSPRNRVGCEIANPANEFTGACQPGENYPVGRWRDPHQGGSHQAYPQASDIFAIDAELSQELAVLSTCVKVPVPARSLRL